MKPCHSNGCIQEEGSAPQPPLCKQRSAMSCLPRRFRRLRFSGLPRSEGVERFQVCKVIPQAGGVVGRLQRCLRSWHARRQRGQVCLRSCQYALQPIGFRAYILHLVFLDTCCMALGGAGRGLRPLPHWQRNTDLGGEASNIGPQILGSLLKVAPNPNSYKA